MIVKTQIVKLVQYNERNLKIGSIRYMFASAREQLVKKMYQDIQLIKQTIKQASGATYFGHRYTYKNMLTCICERSTVCKIIKRCRFAAYCHDL